tara:strand:- start:465 stop:1268 length:804 start_codon:yes stop_codon:yes gene_type:complete
MAVNPEEKSWTPGTYERSKDDLSPNYRQVEDKFGYDREDVATPTFGFGKKTKTGIYATIDKILSGGTQKGITTYKNGQVTSGQDSTSSEPKLSPLLTSLGENMKDDAGIFQGGRSGRMFGRIRDKIDDIVSQGRNNNREIVQNGETSAGDMPDFDVNNNEQVATMQNMLIQLGYLSGDMEKGEGADGMFGKNTEAAWRAYTNDQRKLRGQEEYTYKNQDIKQEINQGNIGESVETNLDRFGFGTNNYTDEDYVNQRNNPVSYEVNQF